MPSEISEAIIRLQMRTDVLKSDQKILTDELQMRIREINTLTKSVADLREERTKIHETIGSYQRQVIVSTSGPLPVQHRLTSSCFLYCSTLHCTLQ